MDLNSGIPGEPHIDIEYNIPVPVQDKTDLCTEYQQLVVLFALTSSFAAESREA